MYTEPNLTLLTAAFTPKSPTERHSPRDHEQRRQDGIGAINRLYEFEIAAVDAYRHVLALFPVLQYIGLNSAMVSNLGAHHQRADQLREYLFRLGHHPTAAAINSRVIIQMSDESGLLLGAKDVLTALADMEQQGVINYRNELCHHLDEQSDHHINTDLLPAQERAASTIASLTGAVTVKFQRK